MRLLDAEMENNLDMVNSESQDKMAAMEDVTQCDHKKTCAADDVPKQELVIRLDGVVDGEQDMTSADESEVNKEQNMTSADESEVNKEQDVTSADESELASERPVVKNKVLPIRGSSDTEDVTEYDRGAALPVDAESLSHFENIPPARKAVNLDGKSFLLPTGNGRNETNAVEVKLDFS